MFKILKKLRHKVILYIFNYYYQDFIYGFDKADAQIAQLSDPARVKYFESISEWVNSAGYEVEHDGVVREYYEKLATESKSEDIIAAYRLALLFIKSQDIRLRTKSEQFSAELIGKKQFNSLPK